MKLLSMVTLLTVSLGGAYGSSSLSAAEQYNLNTNFYLKLSSKDFAILGKYELIRHKGTIDFTYNYEFYNPRTKAITPWSRDYKYFQMRGIGIDNIASMSSNAAPLRYSGSWNGIRTWVRTDDINGMNDLNNCIAAVGNYMSVQGNDDNHQHLEIAANNMYLWQKAKIPRDLAVLTRLGEVYRRVFRRIIHLQNRYANNQPLVDALQALRSTMNDSLSMIHAIQDYLIPVYEGQWEQRHMAYVYSGNNFTCGLEEGADIHDGAPIDTLYTLQQQINQLIAQYNN